MDAARVGAFLVLASGCLAIADAADSYAVHRVDDAAIVVDGKIREASWANAALETGFSFPWQERDAPRTEFRALTDEQFFYFAFIVEDFDIVIDPGGGEEAVARGDRVELFFTPRPELDDYICLEIDPSGRVLDYRAAYYRRFDNDWDLPELAIAAERTDTGYVVEGRIPYASFRDAGLPSLYDGATLLTGIFRAEYSHRDDAAPLEEWISWVRPSSAEPDFHTPSAFGRLEKN